MLVAGRRSGWSEFLRAREQERARIEREKSRIDAAVQRERQEEERARRAAERRAQADAKERDRLAHETAAAEAEERSEEVNAKVRRLETILDGANPTPFSFEGLRRVARIPRFDLARFGPSAQSPDWQEFAPEGPPWGLAAKFGGRARYEQALEEARRLHQEALDAAQLAEASQQERIRQAREEHQRRADAIRAEVSRHNQAVDLFEAAFLGRRSRRGRGLRGTGTGPVAVPCWIPGPPQARLPARASRALDRVPAARQRDCAA